MASKGAIGATALIWAWALRNRGSQTPPMASAVGQESWQSEQKERWDQWGHRLLCTTEWHKLSLSSVAAFRCFTNRKMFHLDYRLLRRSPGWDDLSMKPPTAVGVYQMPLQNHVLQDIPWLFLTPQHQPPEAVVDGHCLIDNRKAVIMWRGSFRMHYYVNEDLGHRGTWTPKG